MDSGLWAVGGGRWAVGGLTAERRGEEAELREMVAARPLTASENTTNNGSQQRRPGPRKKHQRVSDQTERHTHTDKQTRHEHTQHEQTDRQTTDTQTDKCGHRADNAR